MNPGSEKVAISRKVVAINCRTPYIIIRVGFYSFSYNQYPGKITNIIPGINYKNSVPML